MAALVKILDRRPERGRLGTGHFATRAELTRHVWAMHRLQVFPNQKAIARACGTGVSVVTRIIETGEGRQDYLAAGCLTGA